MKITELSSASEQKAFTLFDLAAVSAVLILFGLMLVPALTQSRSHGTRIQCKNNLRQLANAWNMYVVENNGLLVSSYPQYGSWRGTWCAGNAVPDGSPGNYVYGGADPAGITNGLLWPYTANLKLYECSLDHHIATSATAGLFVGKPILRSVSMNSYLAGRSMGANPDYIVTSPGSRDPVFPVLRNISEITRPSRVFVITEEDPYSINDGMFIVDVGGETGLIDLPSRLHNNGYEINFADGHVESETLSDPRWSITGPYPKGADWQRMVSVTTNPLP